MDGKFTGSFSGGFYGTKAADSAGQCPALGLPTLIASDLVFVCRPTTPVYRRKMRTAPVRSVGPLVRCR